MCLILMDNETSPKRVTRLKVIISRKGFDSGTGGVPSPILPDGRMFSLPIPGGSRQRYNHIETPIGPMSHLVADLTRGKMRGTEIAHLDPDLSPASLARKDGWRPSLGQTGIAQSHLAAKGVGEGDIFIFFGWFRPVEKNEKGWRFVPGARDEHVIFGYLQVGQVLTLGARPNIQKVVEERGWLEGHPHLVGHRDDNNTLYLASDELLINGKPTGLCGAGAFETYRSDRVLTAPEGPKSRWAIPDWLMPNDDRLTLSYHGAPERWSRNEQGQARLQTVAKGQEFVFDAHGLPEVDDWIASLVQPLPQIKLASEPRRRSPGM